MTESLEFGVLKSVAGGDCWNVALNGGSKEVIPIDEFDSLVIKKSPEAVWGDMCAYCGKDIE